ncbi:MAG: hypothetical protein IT548_02205 [Alphaproteobacteria bacterium]|nr:hypothetical protein [Alphaproteobacteria bacterium]
MVKAIFAVAGGVAFVAVMLAVFSALQMMRYRKPGVPTSWYAFNGYAFFTGKNFEPPAEPLRRLFAMCMIAFLVAILIGIAFGMIGWPDPNAPLPAE